MAGRQEGEAGEIHDDGRGHDAEIKRGDLREELGGAVAVIRPLRTAIATAFIISQGQREGTCR